MLYVKDIMTYKVKTIAPTETIRDAAKAMAASKIGSVIVVARGKPVGIVTEGDISRAIAKGLDPDKVQIKSVMSKRLVTTTPEERVESAARQMADAGIKKLPVVDGGKVTGIVTQTDIVASSFDLVNALKEMVRARYRPPDFQP